MTYHIFQSSGVAIHYTDEGEGAPVLLIHGYSGAATMWEASGTKAMLAENFRVIAPDCRGHGQSGKPHGPNAYGRAMVGDLVRLLDELTIGEADVVGYSMGAEIGLRLVVEHPDRVRSLVIGGSGWSGQADAENYRNLAGSLQEGSSFGPIVRAMTPPGDPEPTEAEIAALDQVLEGQDTAALVGVAQGMSDIIHLPAEAISSIAVPVLGIAGEHDPERDNLERLTGTLPDYRLQVLAGRDHMSAVSDPRFNTSIIEFLKARR